MIFCIVPPFLLFALAIAYIVWWYMSQSPPLNDADLLPPSKMIRAMLATNKAFERRCREQLAICKPEDQEWFEQVLAETRALNDFWTDAYIASLPIHPFHERQQALSRMQARIGRGPFYRQEWLPVVPPWCHLEANDTI
jgi:hypothetical protein